MSKDRNDRREGWQTSATAKGAEIIGGGRFISPTCDFTPFYQVAQSNCEVFTDDGIAKNEQCTGVVFFVVSQAVIMPC